MQANKKTTIAIDMSVHVQLKELSKNGQCTQGDAIKVLIEGSERIVQSKKLHGELPGQKHRARIKEKINAGDEVLAKLYEGVDLDAEPKGRAASTLYNFHEIALEAWRQLHSDKG